MRCEAFRRRMHQRLDGRMPLESDAQLRRHADACAECRGELQAWQQVASILPGKVLPGDRSDPADRPAPADRPDPADCPTRVDRPAAARRAGWLRPAGRAAAVGLAASVRVLWGLRSVQPPGRESPPQPAVVQPAERALAYPVPPADPQQWWSRMRERPWLDSAIPAARSVGEGVAPLGRSLLQAVAILAHGQGTGTS